MVDEESDVGSVSPQIGEMWPTVAQTTSHMAGSRLIGIPRCLGTAWQGLEGDLASMAVN